MFLYFCWAAQVLLQQVNEAIKTKYTCSMLAGVLFADGFLAKRVVTENRFVNELDPLWKMTLAPNDTSPAEFSQYPCYNSPEWQ